MSGYRLGVDIGGTFTDIVLLAQDGELYAKKVLSSPRDYSEAIGDGVRALLTETGVAPAAVTEIAHGTTIATNAIIERTGVKVALITTKGFRDVLEIARFRSPRLYDVEFRKPEPLVERRLRFEVPERLASDGTTVRAVDESAVVSVAERCQREGVEAVAVCLINAYVDGRHEEQVATCLREHLPGVPVTISSEMVPQIQEYERTSTTVINAYIRPVIERYVTALEARLQDLGIQVPLNIMQSNGGIMSARTAAAKPIFIIESGPAAGVVGVRHLAQRDELTDVLAFDMGGTTAKAAIIVDGQIGMTPETEVGGGESLGHRMVRGGGYVVQAPTIDIAEVGAGGGSIAWIDAGGGLQVGPRSAGADPGPVCYGLGGTAPTVTDANLALGYLNPGALVGGDLNLDERGAKQALDLLAGNLGRSTTDTAFGIHLIANARMMRALSAVSSERGLDPARFTMLAFGGNGGVHACGLAESLGINRVLAPPVAGLFSALGLIFAPPEHQCVRAFYHRFDTLDLDRLNAALGALRNEASALLRADGFADVRQDIQLTADVKYVGQNAALPIAWTEDTISTGALAAAAEQFATAHLETFGYRSDAEALQLVALKATARGVTVERRVPDTLAVVGRDDGGAIPARRAYFGEAAGWCDTPVVRRGELADAGQAGPLIVEEYDSTTVVKPGWSATVDARGNVVLERKG